MLLAYEKGAALIVSVGAHFNLRRVPRAAPGRDVLDLPDAAADRRDAGRREGRQPPLSAALSARRANYRGRRVLFPLGRAPARGRRSSPSTAGLSRWLVFLCGVGYLGLLDDLAGGPARGWRGHGLAAEPRASSRPARSRRSGTVALAAYAVAGEDASGAELLVDRARARARGAPRKPARHAAGATGEGAGARRRGRLPRSSGAWRRSSRSRALLARGRGLRLAHAAASGRCSATPARA